MKHNRVLWNLSISKHQIFLRWTHGTWPHCCTLQDTAAERNRIPKRQYRQVYHQQLVDLQSRPARTPHYFALANAILSLPISPGKHPFLLLRTGLRKSCRRWWMWCRRRICKRLGLWWLLQQLEAEVGGDHRLPWIPIRWSRRESRVLSRDQLMEEECCRPSLQRSARKQGRGYWCHNRSTSRQN